MARLQSPRSRAFTLIELLVVVAIISLLVAILLPSLGAARNQGKSARCLANLHAIGEGFAAYASDNQQAIMPYAWNDDSNTHNGQPYGFNTSYWFPEMAEWGFLTQGNTNSDNSSGAKGVTNINHTPKSTVFMCPSGLDRSDATWQGFDLSSDPDAPNSYNVQHDTQNRVYQCNYLMAGLDPGTGVSPASLGTPAAWPSWYGYMNDPGPNLGSMYPARYVIPTDFTGYAKEYMVEQPSAVGLMTDGFCLFTYGSFGLISTRHGNDGNSSANWLFMDGHATTLKKGTYPNVSVNPWNGPAGLEEPQFEVRVTLRRL